MQRKGRRNPMKGFGVGIVTAIAVIGIVAMLATNGCETIEPGYVGIKVNQWGTDRGVDQYPILVGRVSYNSVSEKIYKFPVYLQNYPWTASPLEGAPHDESLSFASKEGLALGADISIQYAFDQTKIAHLFVEFKADADHIRDGFLHQVVRDELNRMASELPVMDILGPKKQELIDKTRASIQKIAGPKGIRVESLSFLSEIRPKDEKVKAAISNVVESLQQSVQAENLVRRKKAEADQQIETARGLAESEVLKAEAEAKAILAKARAQAEANKLQAQSLSPELLQFMAIEKWKGDLPQMMGSGALPFIQLQPAAAHK
jgi:regulator of protease activity HflC (stomatin/prohibitin superfamily)